MNLKWSFEALQSNNWDYAAAAAKFTELQVTNYTTNHSLLQYMWSHSIIDLAVIDLALKIFLVSQYQLRKKHTPQK